MRQLKELLIVIIDHGALYVYCQEPQGHDLSDARVCKSPLTLRKLLGLNSE